METVNNFLDSSFDPEVEESPLVKYEGIDPRIKLLSHSSRTTLHKCPRRFQLYRLSATEIESADDAKTGVTFAYGTTVGVGIQSVLENKTEQQVFMDMFLSWREDLLAENPKQAKSFWLAVHAVQRFVNICAQGYLQEYELVYWEGKPAIELSFRITLPGGFQYRGYVDAVLRHKTTGQVLVLEAKTSSGNANSAQYKNSGQALGYSVVLDKIFPELSSYNVLYLVYSTKSKEFAEFSFEKSLLLRALWLQELLIDCKHIELYEEFDCYPMHGESCYDFFRECEYLGLCVLPTERLVKGYTEKMAQKIAEESYTFDLDFFELVESQLAKGTGE